eukprot:354426-Chlamydomonas_euryale.AAC.3
MARPSLLLPRVAAAGLVGNYTGPGQLHWPRPASRPGLQPGSGIWAAGSTGTMRRYPASPPCVQGSRGLRLQHATLP